MPIQKAYVHFHPPPRGGYYTLFRFLDEVYNSASHLGGIIFVKDLFQLYYNIGINKMMLYKLFLEVILLHMLSTV